MSKLEIPFHRPTIYDHHLKAVEATLRSGWLTTGARVQEFEETFAKKVGAKYAVALNSCTAALHLALIALKVGPGDEVITSSITFASAVNVIEHVGATPVFADVRPDDLTLDAESVRSKISTKTRAIIATHFAGVPVDMDAIEAVAGRIPIVTDAAHAVEAQYHGRLSGQLGDVQCYSFYANKNITTGEGGMLTTSDPKVADLARILRLHGMTKDAWSRYGPEGYKHWDVVAPGWKYNMSDVAAALGVAQLAEIDGWHEQRIMLDMTYRHLIGTDLATLVQNGDEGVMSARHLLVVRVRERDKVMEEMQRLGVGVGVHFRAVHQLHYYRERYRCGDLPVAESVSGEVLSLPLYPSMTVPDVYRVVDAFRAAVDSVKHNLC